MITKSVSGYSPSNSSVSISNKKSSSSSRSSSWGSSQCICIGAARFCIARMGEFLLHNYPRFHEVWREFHERVVCTVLSEHYPTPTGSVLSIHCQTLVRASQWRRRSQDGAIFFRLAKGHPFSKGRTIHDLSREDGFGRNLGNAALWIWHFLQLYGDEPSHLRISWFPN